MDIKEYFKNKAEAREMKKLEKLLPEKAENCFKKNVYESLDDSKRRILFKCMELRLAKEMGVKNSPELKIKSMKNGDMGSYDEKKNVIVLNRAFLYGDIKNGLNSFQTLAHEMMHCYQAENKLRRMDIEANFGKYMDAGICGDNKRIYTYVSSNANKLLEDERQAKFVYAVYQLQPTEYEAFLAGADRLDKLVQDIECMSFERRELQMYADYVSDRPAVEKTIGFLRMDFGMTDPVNEISDAIQTLYYGEEPFNPELTEAVAFAGYLTVLELKQSLEAEKGVLEKDEELSYEEEAEYEEELPEQDLEEEIEITSLWDEEH